MGPFILAWLVGESIIVYRSIRQSHSPPMPGTLLASSGLFALLALLAESERARPVAIALGYGFDLAALMNLFDPTFGAGPKPKPQPAGRGGFGGQGGTIPRPTRAA